MSRSLSPLPVKRAKTKLVIATVLAFMGLGVGAAVLIPKIMVSQATQAPSNTGTFVSREAETVSLQDKMQAALQNGGSTPAESRPDDTPSTGSEYRQQTPDRVSLSDSQNPSVSTSNQHSNSGTTHPPISHENTTGTVTSPQMQSEPYSTAQTDPNVPAPVDTKDFRVSMSESEISSLIYNGLIQGTAPQYRESIQGVSTRISNGQASITVALNPRHLPDAFLRNLPGVNRDTPTVYLGGDLGLQQEGNSVNPQIHQVRLGNFRVPMPFLNTAIKSQVQAYVGNMLQMPDGRRAELKSIQLENGSVTLQGALN